MMAVTFAFTLFTDIPFSAASFDAAARAGHAVQLDVITSIATSLGAKRVCDLALQRSRQRPITSVLVEPACGASLALAYEKSPALEQFSTVLIVVCGGATATMDQIRQWAETYA